MFSFDCYKHQTCLGDKPRHTDKAESGTNIHLLCALRQIRPQPKLIYSSNALLNQWKSFPLKLNTSRRRVFCNRHVCSPQETGWLVPRWNCCSVQTVSLTVSSDAPSAQIHAIPSLEMTGPDLAQTKQPLNRNSGAELALRTFSSQSIGTHIDFSFPLQSQWQHWLSVCLTHNSPAWNYRLFYKH